MCSDLLLVFYGGVYFLIIECLSLLRVLSMHPVPGVCLANVLSQFAACLLILVTMALREQAFEILMKSLYRFGLLWIVLLVSLRSLCRTEGGKDSPLYFLLAAF